MIRRWLGIALLALGGCASISEGTIDSSRTILLTSTPSAAVVTQKDRRVCTTPCTVRQGQLRYAESFAFLFPDGRSMKVDPAMQANGAILGNILFGGVAGAAVDALTGRLVVNGRHIHAEQSEATE